MSERTDAPMCADYTEITELRATHPAAIGGAWQNRTTRPTVRGNGRLMIVAADHPARGALAVGSRPTAMSSRNDLLDRLRSALADPGVDGVLATSDILDDLLLLGALENKVVFSSFNRGGLAGACFEFDDQMTGATADSTAAARMNGGKMLCRIALDDPGTVTTMAACSGRLGFSIFLSCSRALKCWRRDALAVRAEHVARSSMPQRVLRS